jgi:hypothetical protein
VSIGALVATRSTGALLTGAALPDLAVLLVGLPAALLIFLLRQRLPPRGSLSPDDWWRAHLGRAILIWGLLEGLALLGAVSLFATRRVAGFALLALGALAGLVALTPGRLLRD